MIFPTLIECFRIYNVARPVRRLFLLSAFAGEMSKLIFLPKCPEYKASLAEKKKKKLSSGCGRSKGIVKHSICSSRFFLNVFLQAKMYFFSLSVTIVKRKMACPFIKKKAFGCSWTFFFFFLEPYFFYTYMQKFLAFCAAVRPALPGRCTVSQELKPLIIS